MITEPRWKSYIVETTQPIFTPKQCQMIIEAGRSEPKQNAYVGNHKGTTIVHSSTWQDQTDYQRMLGFQPKPCILTVVNLHTFATASVPFA